MTNEPHVQITQTQPPPGIPPWLAGALFLVTTLVSSFTGGYLAISGDVKDYIKGRNEIEIRKLEYTAKCNESESSERTQMRDELSKLRNALLDKNSALQHDLAAEKDKSVNLEQQVTELQRSAKERKSK